MGAPNDRVEPSWLLKTIEAIVVPITSTAFELLLVGFAAFFPAYLFKIEHPLVIYSQIVTVSITVAFFQGCRSLGYFSYIKKDSPHSPKYLWLLGVTSVIPLNLITLLYFGLYSHNPLMESAKIIYVQVFAGLLILLNFAVGAHGSQKQYKAIEQKQAQEAMRLFSSSVALVLLGWTIIFLIMIFILRLDISSRFPR